MNNTIDRFEKKLNDLEASSKVMQTKGKKQGYVPYSPKKSVIQQSQENTPKKRIMTSKPKPYVLQHNNGKFEGQCPLDYGRIKKVHSNDVNSSAFLKKNSTVELGDPHNKSVYGVPPQPA